MEDPADGESADEEGTDRDASPGSAGAADDAVAPDDENSPAAADSDEPLDDSADGPDVGENTGDSTAGADELADEEGGESDAEEGEFDADEEGDEEGGRSTEEGSDVEYPTAADEAAAREPIDEPVEGSIEDPVEGPTEEPVEEFDEGLGPEHATEPSALDRKGDGPPADSEQPLAEHIEEMVKRLAIVVVVAGVVSVAVFPLGEEIINFLWYSILPGTDVAKPHVYHPLELLLTQFKVASLAGLIAGLPVFVYETYAFMRPGLYPNERRYYLAAVPTSLVLAFLGVTFAYFVVLPAVMSYFLYYSQDVANISFALGQTFDLILLLMGYLAVVFQIPLFIMLAIMMGLTTRQWLADRRLLFWGAFAGISFLFSPDPTGMAPALVAVTMIVLFEGTLLLLRWTDR